MEKCSFHYCIVIANVKLQMECVSFSFVALGAAISVIYAYILVLGVFHTQVILTYSLFLFTFIAIGYLHIIGSIEKSKMQNSNAHTN